jgi:hypothetical protein
MENKINIKKLTYQEAEEQAFKVKWKSKPCHVGESCWCRVIVPEEPIYYMDGEIETEYHITQPGETSVFRAEYFVKLHNKHLQ